LLQFSKGTSLFRPTYNLFLKTDNVGGLKKHASVLMSGVPVGTVSDIELNPEGTNVVITLKIYKNYLIRKDAIVRVEQAGFLGDQYIAIVPTFNQREPYQPDDHLDAEPPFNLQQVARSAAGFLKSVDQTTKRLDDAIADVRRLLLNEETLTNLAVTVGNARMATEHAVTTVDNINALVTTNSEAIAAAVSNVVGFSQQMNQFGSGLKEVLATNSDELNASLKNFEASTETLKSLIEDVKSGKGLAGDVLRNEQLATNVNAIAANLTITTSNLNRLGLWHFLWHKEVPPDGKYSKMPPNNP
jgi:phospholipid/cholesterol/gamma-HCH transport system substrate-binding protein